MKHKSLVIGLVAAVLVGGISWSALASSVASSGSNHGVLLAAKKGKKGKKAKKVKKEKEEKSPEATVPAETSAPPVAEPAAGPTSEHAADVTLKCGAKDIVLQFVDTADHAKDGIWPLDNKRKECVSAILDAWRADFKFDSNKAFPDTIMKQRLGVSPVAYVDTFYSDGRKMWKFYFSGDSILSPLGDKFAPPADDSHYNGAECYSYTLTDGRAMPKIAADSAMVGKWTTSWQSSGYAKDNPSCLPKS